jgi:hypothetical protein
MGIVSESGLNWQVGRYTVRPAKEKQHVAAAVMQPGSSAALFRAAMAF